MPNGTDQQDRTNVSQYLEVARLSSILPQNIQGNQS
jgi:hypothetical protein